MLCEFMGWEEKSQGLSMQTNKCKLTHRPENNNKTSSEKMWARYLPRNLIAAISLLLLVGKFHIL